MGLGEVLGRVTMQVFVRGYCTMIAAPVQCDVDASMRSPYFGTYLPATKILLDMSISSAYIIYCWFAVLY